MFLHTSSPWLWVAGAHQIAPVDSAKSGRAIPIRFLSYGYLN